MALSLHRYPSADETRGLVIKPNEFPQTMSPYPKPSQDKGFALIVTLSLMILLTVIAVGLLTLASITLRSSGQGNSTATARANARLALLMAIGELQKTVGPDRAVTASSGIVDENPAKPNMAGVWESWNFDPTASLNYNSEKANRFKGWLVSAPNPADARDSDFAKQAWSGPSVELVGKGALGPTAKDTEKTRAGWVKLTQKGAVTGAYAWQVADESVKARINLYRDPGLNGSLWQKRALLSGQRPDSKLVSHADSGNLGFLPSDVNSGVFGLASASSGKVLSLAQTSLLDKAEDIRPFRNDVTPYSKGLMTNVREGGLKKDLSLAFASGTLPDGFSGANAKLYKSTLGLTGVSDPYWSRIADYCSLATKFSDPDRNPTYNSNPTEPLNYATVTPPKKYNPYPVVAKVEVLFTFVARDAHSNWKGTLSAVDPQMKYMGHLMYTPLVTLHNPYNVSLSFNRFKVTIHSVPIGFKFYVNGQAQSGPLVPLNSMFYGGFNKIPKDFILDIAKWPSPTSATPSGAITMKPGQTLVCSPYLDPKSAFSNQITPFFDYTNTLTNVQVKSKPGFQGRCVGYDVDWTTPFETGTQRDKVAVTGLRYDDPVEIEYGLVTQNVGLAGEFRVETEINGVSSGGLNFTYGNQGVLDGLIAKKTNRFSTTTASCYTPNATPLNSHTQARTFCVFSAYSRTTNGGVYETNQRSQSPGALNALRDGKLAGKPYLFHNPAVPVSRVDLQTGKQGASSYELNLQPFQSNGQVDDYFSADATDRSPAITGNSTSTGIKSATYLELPTGPLQTLADLRRSNVMASSYLPAFVQPISNSTVSPLMSTDKVMQTNSNASPYEMMDHSVLANHALYDGYYFSTIANYGNEGADTIFEHFMDGTRPLVNQAFEAYLPDGQTAAEAKKKIFSGGKPGSDSYLHSASYQLVRGPFNVNSTSVQAWKAMLATLSGSEINVLWGRNVSLESKKSSGYPVMAMSLPNGGPVNSSAIDAAAVDNFKTNEWNGYRELDESQLQTLAEKIVDEVRKRGPFLSMSEFVNRRIGPESELTRTGALQAAIDKSEINAAVFKDQVGIGAGDIADAKIYPYATPAVVTGNPAAGAPGWLMQGDLMKLLEPAATVRSDTFVIRVCGEAREGSRVTARAYAEAVIQRLPEYVDPANDSSVNVTADTAASVVNKTFGRRMNLVSFRWLSPEEI